MTRDGLAQNTMPQQGKPYRMRVVAPDGYHPIDDAEYDRLIAEMGRAIPVVFESYGTIVDGIATVTYVKPDPNEVLYTLMVNGEPQEVRRRDLERRVCENTLMWALSEARKNR